MKTTFSVIFLFCFVIVSHAQTKKDIFDSNVPVTWLGIDFSGAKFIGDRERLQTQSDAMKLMTDLNNLMKAEADKFNVGRAMNRKDVVMDIEVTKEHNAALEVNDVFSEKSSDHLALTPAGVEAIIETYDFKDHTGLGVMFNVGSFNKYEEEGVLYFTVVNMETKEVLLSERYVQKPGGLNIRNYWSRTIYDTIDKIDSKDFNTWKKKYSY